MNRGIDIIYFTLFPWENAYSSVSLSFTREFQKNNRVFYINKPLSHKDLISVRGEDLTKERMPDLIKGKMRYEQIPGFSDNVIAVHPPLVVPINFLPPGMMYDKLKARNERIVADCIQQVIKDYDIKEYVYFNCYNPFMCGTLPKDIHPQPLLNIYQCIDDISTESYVAKHGTKLEQKVVAESDITVCTGTMLKKIMDPFNDNVHLLHNAVELSIFEKALNEKFEVPTEMQGIKEKVIGFTGNLDPDRIDYELIKKIADHHTDKKLVLVGPINADTFEKVGLDKSENVITTGPKNINDLPKYLQHMDCTIIPFLLNKQTASIYPLKINEYLAAGKAVVSTSFSDDIRGFKEVIFLADSHDHFLTLINEAIVSNNEENINKRAKVASSNTWTDRVRQFWEIVDNHLELTQQTA